MAKLIYCKGLPGSGKSTWAREFALEALSTTGEIFDIINKDDIREQFARFGWKWSHDAEKQVEAERDTRIISAFAQGHSVISTDTNFARKHKVRFEQMAQQHKATLELKSFTDVPIEVCVERDSKREGTSKVGEKVIKDMAAKYLPQMGEVELKIYVPNPFTPSAVICDLDGTLSLFEKKGHRGPFDASKCDEDDCNLLVRDLLWMYYSYKDCRIIYLSGREDVYEGPTRRFLEANRCPVGPLFMRKARDFRKDWIVKNEIFDAHVRDFYNVKLVLDDRDQVVQMWRKLGLTCFQVANGNF